jgi:hypothetical protein
MSSKSDEHESQMEDSASDDDEHTCACCGKDLDEFDAIECLDCEQSFCSKCIDLTVLNGGAEDAHVCDDCYEDRIKGMKKALDDRKKAHKH